jgi:hypothetical protein
MAAWLIIRPDGYIENSCEWDGKVWAPENPDAGGWTPPEGKTMVLRPQFTWDAPMSEGGTPEYLSAIPGAGWLYQDGSWFSPNDGLRFDTIDGSTVVSKWEPT